MCPDRLFFRVPIGGTGICQRSVQEFKYENLSESFWQIVDKIQPSWLEPWKATIGTNFGQIFGVWGVLNAVRGRSVRGLFGTSLALCTALLSLGRGAAKKNERQLVPAIPQSEVLAKFFKEIGEKCGEILANFFADFRPSMSRENGRKKCHEKSSTFSTVHQIKFFSLLQLWGPRGPKANSTCDLLSKTNPFAGHCRCLESWQQSLVPILIITACGVLLRVLFLDSWEYPLHPKHYHCYQKGYRPKNTFFESFIWKLPFPFPRQELPDLFWVTVKGFSDLLLEKLQLPVSGKIFSN